MSPPNTYTCPYCHKRVRGQLNFVDHLVVERTPSGGITTSEIMRAGAGERFGARVHEINKLRDSYRIESFYSSPGNFIYVAIDTDGVQGGGAQSERAQAQRSSSPGQARAATLNAAGPSRWFCYATRACITAGPLDGPACPRGAGHETHTEMYLDFTAGAVESEQVAA